MGTRSCVYVCVCRAWKWRSNERKFFKTKEIWGEREMYVKEWQTWANKWWFLRGGKVQRDRYRLGGFGKNGKFSMMESGTDTGWRWVFHTWDVSVLWDAHVFILLACLVEGWFIENRETINFLAELDAQLALMAYFFSGDFLLLTFVLYFTQTHHFVIVDFRDRSKEHVDEHLCSLEV